MALVGLVVTVAMTGPPGAPGPFSGLDPSWVVGLNAARGAGLEFGPDIVYTYGPWGFLDHPVTLSRLQFVLGVAAAVAVVASLFWVLALGLRRLLPVVPAVALAAVATMVMAAISETSLLVVTAAATAAVLTTLDTDPAREGRLPVHVPAVVLAAVGALLVQVKLSSGVSVIVLAVLVACVQHRPTRIVRDLAAVVVTLVVTFVLAWVAIGQSLDNLGAWLHGSVAIASGYGEAMALERPDSVFGYLTGVAVVAAILVWALVSWREPDGRLGRVGATLVTLVMVGFAFKTGFTRHDDHELAFFVLVGGLVVCWAPYARRRAAAIVALAGVFAMILPGLGWLDVKGARDRWRVATEVALKSGAAAGYTESARLLGQQGYLVPQPYLDEIGRHPVAIDPYDTAIAIDYRLNWRPMPVFQSYVAYTPYLDDLNARAAQDAPDDQYVLRRAVPAVDGRNTVWETPAYLLTLACDYTRVIGDQYWTLLRHSPTPHCQAPEDAGSMPVRGGEPVTVPKPGPDEMVVARFEPDGPGLVTRLFHAALKDYSPYQLTVDGVAYRMPEALATQDVLMGYPDQGELGLFAPFQFGTLSYPDDGTVHFSTIKLDQ